MQKAENIYTMLDKNKEVNGLMVQIPSRDLLTSVPKKRKMISQRVSLSHFNDVDKMYAAAKKLRQEMLDAEWGDEQQYLLDGTVKSWRCCLVAAASQKRKPSFYRHGLRWVCRTAFKVVKGGVFKGETITTTCGDSQEEKNKASASVTKQYKAACSATLNTMLADPVGTLPLFRKGKNDGLKPKR